MIILVTPYGGVWIEIRHCGVKLEGFWSRLMEACGLKCRLTIHVGIQR